MQQSLRITGLVRRGNRIGHAIGVPTVNIDIPPNAEAPPRGVYFTRLEIHGEEGVFNAVTNVGVRPTVSGGDVNAESHILGFNREIYDKLVTVEFVEFMRPEMKFGSLEELKAQIARDIGAARGMARID